MGFEEGVRCLLVWIPQWGFCRCLHFRFRVAAYDVGELAHGLRGICWPWQCGRGCRRRGGVGGSSSWSWPA